MQTQYRAQLASWCAGSGVAFAMSGREVEKRQQLLFLNGWWRAFKADTRGFRSFRILVALFAVSLLAEFIVNDRPLFIRDNGKNYFPGFVTYQEKEFGSEFETPADYRDPYLQKLIDQNGGIMVWTPIRYSYDTHNLDLPTLAPSKPTWLLSEEDCKPVIDQKGLKNCRDLEYNWLGTDDQGRDLVARLIYGVRYALLAGLAASILWLLIGTAIRVALRRSFAQALLATVQFVPSVFSSAMIALIALDFYGFGTSPGSPSLGEMLSQAKSNPTAPWIGFCVIITIAALLVLLNFIGRAVRGACAQAKPAA
jgi:ABC-type microcin C transport system permease subunit YejE